MARKIFFSVGEPSGDQHTARLITALQKRAPQWQLRGFGGPRMREAGCHLDHEMTRMAVMGIVEVLPKLRRFYRLADQAEEAFAGGEVDAVVLVDFPGFNWHVARRAKRYGLPVFYYLPPQLWAWGSWRVRKMRRYVDHVLSVLPFECQWYQQHGIDAQLVGHPFFDAVAQQTLDPVVIERLAESRRSGRRLIAVLPGSREQEVQRNWPVMLEAIRRLARRHPDARFLVASFRDSQCLWCRAQLTAADRRLPIDFFVGKTSEVIESAECAMMVSGSVSLEMMARNTPAVVIYRAGRVLYATGRLLVRVGSITLPNLIAGQTLFPEMASTGRAEPCVRMVVDSIDRMLSDSDYRAELSEQLNALRRSHAAPGASGRAADALVRALAAAPDASAARAA